MDISSVCGTRVSRVASFLLTFWLLPYLLLSFAVPAAADSSGVPPVFWRSLRASIARQMPPST